MEQSIYAHTGELIHPPPPPECFGVYFTDVRLLFEGLLGSRLTQSYSYTCVRAWHCKDVNSLTRKKANLVRDKSRPCIPQSLAVSSRRYFRSAFAFTSFVSLDSITPLVTGVRVVDRPRYVYPC